MDFLERLVEVLNEQVYYSKVHVPFPTEGNSIALMTIPSQVRTYYYNQSYWMDYNFQVTTKHLKQLQAYQTLFVISGFLCTLPDIPSHHDAYQYHGLKVTTNPNLIAKEDNYTFYAAHFTAELFIRKEEE